MDMYHTIKRISEGCQETRHSINKRNCVYSDVVLNLGDPDEHGNI